MSATTNTDAFGDRMKMYENMEAGRRLMPLLPIVARIDGRAFHSLTRGMDRPYDWRLSQLMQQTTVDLMNESNACIGYTQSDEITLAWHSTSIKSEVWFGGRVCKMVSQLAALATLYFYRNFVVTMPEFNNRLPSFDARVWNVPNRTEGANVFLWREWDAVKNSVTMAASVHYSHAQLSGKNSSQKQDMLHAVGVNWNNYPTAFKRGSYFQRRTLATPFSANEVTCLPPKHHARTNPSLVVERSVVERVDMPTLGSITNRDAVLFDGASPILTTP